MVDRPCVSIGRYRGPEMPPVVRWVPYWKFSIIPDGEIGSIRTFRFIIGYPYKVRKLILRQFYRPQTTVTLINGAQIKFPREVVRWI